MRLSCKSSRPRVETGRSRQWSPCELWNVSYNRSQNFIGIPEVPLTSLSILLPFTLSEGITFSNNILFFHTESPPEADGTAVMGVRNRIF